MEKFNSIIIRKITGCFSIFHYNRNSTILAFAEQASSKFNCYDLNYLDSASLYNDLPLSTSSPNIEQILILFYG